MARKLLEGGFTLHTLPGADRLLAATCQTNEWVGLDKQGDVDVFERKILHRLMREHGIFASTMQDVDRLGIGRVMELALEAVGVTGDGGAGEVPLHLSFDIDSIDPQVLVHKSPRFES